MRWRGIQWLTSREGGDEGDDGGAASCEEIGDEGELHVGRDEGLLFTEILLPFS